VAEHRTASFWAVSGLIFATLAGCQDQAAPPPPEAAPPPPEKAAIQEPAPKREQAPKREASSAGTMLEAKVTAKPKPPLTIQPPPPPPKIFQGKDLTQIKGSQLAGAALQLSNSKRYLDAVQLQYWSTVADDDGRYNLACFEALAGDKDAAFYYLQEAAIKDGVDAEWAREDSDLVSLRSDPRWAQIRPYLDACGAYWAVSGHHQTLLALPDGYKAGTPIGALVWMHGRGSNPDGLLDDLQRSANELGMAIVGVSGTVPRGLHSFVWSEDPIKDAERVRIALKEVSDRLTVKPGQLVLFGFSQGAQMAFEVAFRFPDEFRGAIVISPGTSKSVDLAGLVPGPKNQVQGFVCLCGAKELPGNVANTQQDYDFAKKAGSRIELRLQEGQERHSFPTDFAAKFAGWVRFVLDEKKSEPSP
jgi:pimeloyl-ACP methyl ester carboxylesterase